MSRRLIAALVITAFVQPGLVLAQTVPEGAWRHVSVMPVGLGYHPLPPSELVSDEPPNEAFTEQTREGIACLVAGTVATGLAIGTGWQNVTNLMSGGIVNAATPAAVGLALFGVVFGSFCAIGQALTPVVVNVFDLPPAAPSAHEQSQTATRDVPGDAGTNGDCPDCDLPQRMTIAFDGSLPMGGSQVTTERTIAVAPGCASQIGPLSRYAGAC